VAEPSETLTGAFAGAPTASGLAARLAVAELRRRAIDPGPLLARARLSSTALDHSGRIHVRSQIEFLELASRVIGDDFLGLTVAAQFDLRELGMLYYVAASSDRLGDALRRLERYVRVGNEALMVKVHKGSACRLELSYAGVARHLDTHQIESLALTLVRLLRQLVGQKISPVAASFIHHRSGDLRRARDLLGCGVEFGGEADELRFDGSLLDRTLVDADPFLNRLMVLDCERAIAERPSNASAFRTLVENTIAPLLPHAEATAKEVARRLGLSERTFARRLASERLSFGTILDELRRDLALRYLGERSLQISHIAWRLGFHQPSALSHATRRWTGKTPSQYRNSLSS
jgi:AraC-like DNA-binding protein